MNTRKLWIQVGVLFAVVYLALLWARPMITPDEARYGAMGAEMLSIGEWFKLRMVGFTYYEKPPLGTWCIAASIGVFGHNAFAIRFPCAVASLITAIAAGSVARRMTGRREAAPLAAMVQLTTLFPMVIGTVALLDPIFTAFTSLTLAWFFAATQEQRKTQAIWLLLSGGAAGLAFMTKGLLAFAIPALTAASYLCWQRRWKDLFTMPWLPIMGAVITAGPLALLLHQAEPGFWNYFIVVEHFRRFANPDPNQHVEPWWLLMLVLLGGSLFWLIVWPRAFNSLRGVASIAHGFRFCLCWIVPPLLLLSLSAGKLPTYILPLFAPISVLVAVGLLRWREGVKHSCDSGTRIVLLLLRVLALTAFVLAIIDTHTIGIPQLWLAHAAPRWVLIGIALLTWSVLESFSHRTTQPMHWLARSMWIPVPMLLALQLLLPDALLATMKVPWQILHNNHAALMAADHVVAIHSVGHAVSWSTGRTDLLIVGDPSEFDNELKIESEQGRLLSLETLMQRIPQWTSNGTIVLALETDQAKMLATRFSKLVRSLQTDRDLTLLVLGAYPDTSPTRP